MLALPHGAAATGADAEFRISGLPRFRIERDVAGKKRHEMFGNTDRSDAGAAAAVRNAKRLVQIQMANIRADDRRGGKARPARSCSRRPCKPGRRARERSRKSRGSWFRKRHAWKDRSPSTRRDRVYAHRLLRADRRDRYRHLSSTPPGRTLKPAMTALAGLVPCAEVGMRQILRCASPRDA